MYADVVDLRDFYRSPLGQVARRMIHRRIRQVWPDASGMNVLGFGYAAPFLGPFLDEAERVIACMPAGQGVLAWPSVGANRATVGDDGELPFADLMFDRVLLVHALEATDQLRPLLRETWRVLAGGGRMMVVAPNRRGLWARRDMTPFGHGHPYSNDQLSRVLRDSLFTPTRTTQALFVPPSRWRMLQRAAVAWERAGERWFPRFAGVVMIEATKQIYAATPVQAEARRRRAVDALPAPSPRVGAARNGAPD